MSVYLFLIKIIIEVFFLFCGGWGLNPASYIYVLSLTTKLSSWGQIIIEILKVNAIYSKFKYMYE